MKNAWEQNDLATKYTHIHSFVDGAINRFIRSLSAVDYEKIDNEPLFYPIIL